MPQRVSSVLYVCVLSAVLAAPLHAQTIEDAFMMRSGELQTGYLYSRDTWDRYWEGSLKRQNGNIGKITTETNVWVAKYGIADRLNVLAMVPYVWTQASQGVLHGIQGFQDLTLAAKWNFLDRPLTSYGSLRTFAVLSAGIPMTDYNPELLPLSIGLGSTRVSWRGTANFQSNPGWFIAGSTALSWRSQVQLDRPYYYTDDEFVMSDRVDMPNVYDVMASAGYYKGRAMMAVSYTQQRTLGGGDIRRQDMPFVSNRMNFSKGSAMLMYPLPKIRPLALELGVAHIFNGRNVGESTTLTAGLLYTFNGSSTR
jgi:hypothetical protein